ncbi:MAG: HNH endonuclease family protein [Actinomycetota bacterium]
MKMSNNVSRRLQRSLIVFPALALAVSVGCVSSSGATSSPDAKKTTTTVKKKPVTVTSVKINPPKTTIAKGSVVTNPTALSVLATITVQNEYKSGYSRSLFKHWVDANGNGCDTREEVLIAESVSKAQVDAYGCKVVEGDWLSPYDNVTHTNPSELDIDHMVPLKEAWDSGAWNWTAAQRQTYANDLSDPRPLIAVTAGQNRSKSDKDPANWIPPQRSYQCTYLAEWVAIKAHWNLSMDQSEFGRIKNLLNDSCATTTIAPWGTAGSSVAMPTTVTLPSSGASSSVTLALTTATVAGGMGREVSPVRCKKAEFGQTGQYKGAAYVCSDHRKDGTAYSAGYYMWRPA